MENLHGKKSSKEKRTFHCCFCDKNFSSKSNLFRHKLTSTHKAMQKNMTTRNPAIKRTSSNFNSSSNPNKCKLTLQKIETEVLDLPVKGPANSSSKENKVKKRKTDQISGAKTCFFCKKKFKRTEWLKTHLFYFHKPPRKTSSPIIEDSQLKKNKNPISHLKEIQDKIKGKKPIYTVLKEKGPSQKKIVIQCSLGDVSTTGSSQKRKRAKQFAAKAMLKLMGYSKPNFPSQRSFSDQEIKEISNKKNNQNDKPNQFFVDNKTLVENEFELVNTDNDIQFKTIFKKCLHMSEVLENLGTQSSINFKLYKNQLEENRKLQLKCEDLINKNTAFENKKTALEIEKTFIKIEKTTLERLRTAFENKRTAFKNKRTAFKSKRTAFESKRTAFESEREAFESERTVFESERTTLENERTTLESERTALESERTALENEKTALEIEKTTLGSEKTALKNKLLLMENKFLTAENKLLTAENKPLTTAKELKLISNPQYGQGMNPICRLEEILRIKKEEQPIYICLNKSGKPQQHTIQCSLAGISTTGSSENCKTAMQDAADAMLQLMGYSKSINPSGKALLKSQVMKKQKTDLQYGQNMNAIYCNEIQQNNGIPMYTIIDERRCQYQTEITVKCSWGKRVSYGCGPDLETAKYYATRAMHQVINYSNLVFPKKLHAF